MAISVFEVIGWPFFTSKIFGISILLSQGWCLLVASLPYFTFEGHECLTSDDSSLVVLRLFEDVPGGNSMGKRWENGLGLVGCLSFSSKCNDCENLVFRITPLKINMEHNHFLNGWFVGSMLIFQGVQFWKFASCQFNRVTFKQFRGHFLGFFCSSTKYQMFKFFKQIHGTSYW